MKPGRLTDTLASVKFAVTVVVIIAAACVAGTIRPQWNVFYSWWFVALLATLSASVATCSVRRFATVRRATGSARRRALGSMLTHISILLILAGGVIRGVWGEKGHLEFREGETAAHFVADAGQRALPFAMRLAKFEIETYGAEPAAEECTMHEKASEVDACCNGLLVAWPEKNLKATLPAKVGVEQAFGEFKITVLRYVPDFIVDTKTREVSSRSDAPHNPAILVAVAGPTYSNHRWLFAKFPDFVMHNKDAPAAGPSPLEMVYQNHTAAQPKRMPAGPVKSFKSTVELPDGTHTLEVNRPLSYGGYTFYQSGYNPDDLTYTSLQVVKDPGVPVVYAGFALMLAGLFIVFYLNPWLDARRPAA